MILCRRLSRSGWRRSTKSRRRNSDMSGVQVVSARTNVGSDWRARLRPIRTRSRMRPSTLFRQQAEALRVQRVAQATDVAHAREFLMENTFLTGALIDCDGGLRLL